MYTKYDLHSGNCDEDDFYGQYISFTSMHCVLSIIGIERITKARNDLSDINPVLWEKVGYAVKEAYERKFISDMDECCMGDCIGIAKSSAALIKLLNVKGNLK